mmetsp:Transcript_22119/g.33431  ORF Transcript_22119/g.33431 Transcript_22119/m.33431 type:complete len:328 (-) Transcript_22119:174-1157(-)
MTVFSKEDTSRKRGVTRWNKETGITMILQDLPEDMILIVFGYVSFPKLCRIKTVCKAFLQLIDKAIVIRLGKKQFITNEELIQAVREYRSCNQTTRLEITVRDASIEKLATMYGWPIGMWDVSQVTNFSNVFAHQHSFNEYIGAWNVSNGINFDYMFWHASWFDQDIGNWNVSKAASFEGMFSGASRFNKDLTKWNTKTVENMSSMFDRASKFNGNVSNFDTSEVTRMNLMFSYASDFNQDISGWNTGRVTCMNHMFRGASCFNQDISCWDTSQVIFILRMFQDATSFCQNLTSWDVTNLRRHYEYNEIFDGATSFQREYLPSFISN